MKKLLPRLAVVLVLLSGLLLGAHHLNRTASLQPPAGVTRRTETIILQGDKVPVDLYLPSGVARAPVVIVAHGFTRSRRVMAGWGHQIAQNGMIAAIPNLPSFANHARNARAVAELVALLHLPGRLQSPSPTGEVGLIGHSAGGFATLLAAPMSTQVRCWVGLDPVDFMDQGLAVMKSLTTPALMLLAEPGVWNRSGNAVHWLGQGARDLTTLRVKGSTHCDPEHPSTRLAELACGRTDSKRRALYEGCVLAMLRKHLLKDPAASAILSKAATDKSLQNLGHCFESKLE